MVEFLIGFLAGAVLGGVLTRIVQVIRSTTGAIVINANDPEEEYMKLRFSCADDLFLKRKKYLIARIVRLTDDTSK